MKQKDIVVWDENLELGNVIAKGTKDENRKPETSVIGKLYWESYPRGWHVIFLISCVIGVLIDPLFLYIPIINEDDKCLRRDETMKNIALILRSTTDFAHILDIVVRLRSASKKARQPGSSFWKGFSRWYLLTDILAILPLPQVVVLVFFSKMAGSESLTSRKFLNVFLLAQYVPRIVRIYLSANKLSRAFNPLTRLLWVKGAFNFFLYIIAAHVFGAFWYFHSIFRETACWHHACKRLEGCDFETSFDCHSNFTSTKNLTYINDFCPVNPTNARVYNFGISVNAIESGVLTTTDFPIKLFRCFWWGLQNMSSFGHNLETSIYMWENLLAVLFSILGLLLFIYLIGNLQTYLQLSTTKSEEARQKMIAKEPEIRSYLSSHGVSKDKEKVVIRHLWRKIKEDRHFDIEYLFSLISEGHKNEKKGAEGLINIKSLKWVTKFVDVEKHSAELWILKNSIPSDMKRQIMRYVRLGLQGNDVDCRNILPILPISLAISVKKQLCLETLKKVPMLQNMDKKVYHTICNYLKPVIYSENTYIFRKGEPVDLMLFITQGVVWTFGKTSPMERLQRGNYYGDELIEWRLKSTSDSTFPISTRNVKSHTKVEALALMAIDLENVLSICWSKFQHESKSVLEGLTPFALSSLRELRRRNIVAKKKQ